MFVPTFIFFDNFSGLLLAYNAFKQLKNSKKISWQWFYLHRYLRYGDAEIKGTCRFNITPLLIGCRACSIYNAASDWLSCVLL